MKIEDGLFKAAALAKRCLSIGISFQFLRSFPVFIRRYFVIRALAANNDWPAALSYFTVFTSGDIP